VTFTPSKVCELCGNSYLPKNKLQKACSDCHYELIKRTHRAYRKQRRLERAVRVYKPGKTMHNRSSDNRET
jgi:hypothetical protein